MKSMKSFICCFFMAQADAEAESLMHATGNAKLHGGTGWNRWRWWLYQRWYNYYNYIYILYIYKW
jgi:hypothetical protein